MAITDTNQAVSKGNFITSAHLHFMPLNHGYCSLKQYRLPACILTIPSLSVECCSEGEWHLLVGMAPWHLTQGQYKATLCVSRT